jgi:hypothetical protein
MYQLEKITENFTSIPITRTSFEKMKDYAKIVRGTELYGFLLSPMEYKDGIVRKIMLAKDQIVTSSSASLDPVSAANAKCEIEEMGYKAIGFWHSHGGFNTFHSHTDDENMKDHFMTLALNNQERIEPQSKNSRYIDSENGRMVYRINGLDISISLEKPSKGFEKRFLSGDYIKNPTDAEILAAITGDMQMFLKCEGFYYDIANIKDIQIKRSSPVDIKTLGLAYSIVVNDRGKSYGEMAKTAWCSSCEKQENQIYKDVKVNIVEEGNESYSLDELKKDIAERVKTRPRFGNLNLTDSNIQDLEQKENGGETKYEEKGLCKTLRDMIAKRE